MTAMPIQLPLGGYTEQNQFSATPAGMTPQCLNVMPLDPYNRRMRIGQRHGVQTWNSGAVQFIGVFRAYQGGNFVERIIFVRLGKVYHADPSGSGTATLFGTGTVGTNHTQDNPFLKTSGIVEGVQFNEHFYFVDGTNYALVHLTTPNSATAVTAWGGTSGGGSTKHGPRHTDPANAVAGESATLICRWGARLVLAGYKRTPNVWFACAPDEPYADTTGNSDDGWTGTTANGFIGAIAGTSANSYGTLGDPIVAIFPFGQSGLMFGCTDSFSFMTSDPAFDDSAAIVSLSKSVGIVGPRAWCFGQEKSTYFIGKDGLYQIAPNDFNFNRANRISAGRLDSFFLRLDFGAPAVGGNTPLSGGTLRMLQTDQGSATGADSKVLQNGSLTTGSTTEKIALPAVGTSSLIGDAASGTISASLCWDADREGVWMFLAVSGAEVSSTHVYYDTKTNSFWPQRFYDPNGYAPLSSVYFPQNRLGPGRLFMGTQDAVTVLSNGYSIGIDGYSSNMSQNDQRARHIRSSLTIGPIIATIPYRIMLNEVRADLGSDPYSVPTGFTDLSTPVKLTVSTGETAQDALGLQVGKVFVVNVDPLVVDGGDAPTVPTTPNYDGGTYLAPSPNVLDGRYALRPFGEYAQSDPFSFGTERIFNGPGDWTLKYVTANSRWEIVLSGETDETEYAQSSADVDPNSTYTTVIQNPISPDLKDNAVVSGAAYPTAEVVEIGDLVAGRNDAKRCRIRSEAMYLTLAADGRPWSIERMSAVVSQVGKSRGGGA